MIATSVSILAQVAMVVTSKSSSTEGATTSNSKPVVQSVTHPLEYLLSTQGLGKDLKTHWFVDSGATYHIVAEEWLKLYKVKYWYPSSAPILRGAGDHILSTAGMVDLEFKVGRTPIVMQRVVVARIKLNVRLLLRRSIHPETLSGILTPCFSISLSYSLCSVQ